MRDHQLAAAKAAEQQAREDWRRHRQQCRTCTPVTHSRRRYCSTGWALVQSIRLAEDTVADLVAAAPDQLALF